MKKIIDYMEFSSNMEELLNEMKVSISEDYTLTERESLREYLESYIKRMGSNGSESITYDMGKFYLRIQGADEASYLLYLL